MSVPPMDRAAILARFDAEVRRDPPPEGDARIERVGGVVRAIGEECWVLYSELDPSTAKEEVAAQSAFFRSLGKKTEWKVYAHDRPSNLGELLRAEGFVPEPTETLMVFDLARSLPVDPRVSIRPVVDRAGLETVRQVSAAAFGDESGWPLDGYERRLSDPTFGIYLAYVDGVPVAEGRLEMPVGQSFASLWGGGTVPAYRGRGVYRSLVGARAEIARGRGFRFLTVDAMETSRPILERLGFLAATRVTGWILEPPPTPGSTR